MTNAAEGADGGTAGTAGTVVQEPRRLSESIIWTLNRQFFDERGLEAWSTGTVPSYVTSNPAIAACYAQVVLGYLRDGQASGAIDPAQPVYIVELAAGSGRFAWLFLKKLLDLKAASSLARLDVRYVMTDFTRSNLRAWEAQPRFAEHLRSGVLDLAVLDVDAGAAIELERARTPLATANPLVVLANYAFDTFRQDLFRIDAGKLQEVQVGYRHADPAPDLGRAETLSELAPGYSYRPVEDGYYGDPALDRVLAGYRERLADTTIPIPVGAFSGLRRLLALSRGRILVVASDKAFAHQDELSFLDHQPVQFHGGSLSMMVNFHAIGSWFQNQGGRYLATSQRHLTLRTAAFLLGDGDFPETQLAFREHIDAFGPCDYYLLASQTRRDCPSISLEHFLALLRLSGWDPSVVHEFHKDVLPHVAGASETLRTELRLGLARVWEQYFPMGKDLPFELGRLHLALKLPHEAVRYNHLSMELFGEHPVTFVNLGIAHYYAEDARAALRCFERSLELDPEYGLAKAWRTRLAAELERGGAAPADGDGAQRQIRYETPRASPPTASSMKR